MTIEHTLPSALIVQLQRHRDRLMGTLYAKSTERSYGYDWAMFSAWCKLLGLKALPATEETVAYYLTDIMAQGKKVTTAARRASSIATRHRSAGYPSPVTAAVRALLRGAQRTTEEQPRQKKPLLVRHLREIGEALRTESTPAAARDRAILVIGFASALRRSNLAALQVSDVELTDQFLVLHVGREKNNQHGRGRRICLPRGRRAATCPVRSLRAWLKLRGDEPGALFTCMHVSAKPLQAMSGTAIGNVVHRRVKQIGLDPRHYCGHSMRSGFVTSAGIAGLSEMAIASQTGHRSLAVLRMYFRPGHAFQVSRAIGL